jgi:hypothetical protein
MKFLKPKRPFWAFPLVETKLSLALLACNVDVTGDGECSQVRRVNQEQTHINKTG